MGTKLKVEILEKLYNFEVNRSKGLEDSEINIQP